MRRAESPYVEALKGDARKIGSLAKLDRENERNVGLPLRLQALRGRMSTNSALLLQDGVLDLWDVVRQTGDAIVDLRRTLDGASRESTKLTCRLFWVALFNGLAAAASAVAAITMAW